MKNSHNACETSVLGIAEEEIHHGNGYEREYHVRFSTVMLARAYSHTPLRVYALFVKIFSRTNSG